MPCRGDCSSFNTHRIIIANFLLFRAALECRLLHFAKCYITVPVDRNSQADIRVNKGGFAIDVAIY